MATVSATQRHAYKTMERAKHLTNLTFTNYFQHSLCKVIRCVTLCRIS